MTENELKLKVDLLEWPDELDWMEAKRRALVTIGKSPVNAPTDEWKRAILEARHSPIRRLILRFTSNARHGWQHTLHGTHTRSRTSKANATTGKTIMTGTQPGRMHPYK